MVRIGIAERGDSALDYSWEHSIDSVLFAVLITKQLSDKFIQKVLQYKDKVIVHATITGMGGSRVEPNVPAPEWSIAQLRKLVNSGFPAEQVVLRVDPIVPTPKGIRTAIKVIEMAAETVPGIRRVRYSFMDMYPHVRERFIKAGVRLPYTTFHAPSNMQKAATRELEKVAAKYNLILETCAENSPHATGCVSRKDFEVLGITYQAGGKCQQRPSCLCHGGKVELLRREKKPCPHGCLYCYWRD